MWTISTCMAHFYPRSPCGERLPVTVICNVPQQFLSTLSLRRATVSSRKLPSSCRHFYPRSPCGERQPAVLHNRWCKYFYPRSPCGERQARRARHHARDHFYPRSPCGERQYWATRARAAQLFLSTLSLRRATAARCVRLIQCYISIHALLAESDLYKFATSATPDGISIHALLAESDTRRRQRHAIT